MNNTVQPIHKNRRKQMLDEIDQMERWSHNAELSCHAMQATTAAQKKEQMQVAARLRTIRRHIVSLMESLNMKVSDG